MRAQMSWMPPVLTLLVWALAGASAVSWTLRLTEPAPQAVPAAPPTAAQVRPAAIAKWLGAPEATAVESLVAARYVLLGVIAQGRRGVALLAVDGQPPKPYLVGSPIHEGLILKAVGARYAELAADRRAPVLTRLELPTPPELPLPAGMTVVSKAAAASR
ncbi:MAG: type II secretion system protein N [Betaproteobacteria bacterium]